MKIIARGAQVRGLRWPLGSMFLHCRPVAIAFRVFRRGDAAIRIFVSLSIF